MNLLKFTISIIILILVLSCSKLPFSSNDQKTKEQELMKKEDELKRKEDSLKAEEIKRIEEEKTDLKKKEEELKAKEKNLNRIKATSSPEIIPKQLIHYINEYVTKNDRGFLRRAYNLWHNPLNSIGTFEKFQKGFSNTIDDNVLTTEIISNDGYDAEVLITHTASEINTNFTNNYNKYQKTKYEARYKLVSINGEWKIISGKASVISRDYY